MREILGLELGLPARFIVAFVLVLALIGLTAWLIRQFGSARASNSGGARNRQPRLAVLDSAIVDARRRLVLIRRDNVEHLILIGGPTDVVVEENIVRAQSAAAQSPAPVQRQAPPPRAPIEFEPEFDPTLVPYDEPTYDEPIRPAPAARMPQRPAPRPPVERNAPTPRPAPAARQDQYDDVTKRLEAALRQPAAEPRVAPPPAPTARPAPEPRPTPPAAPAPRAEPAPAPAAAPAKSGGDVFASLEEEMASLLRPNERKTPS